LHACMPSLLASLPWAPCLICSRKYRKLASSKGCSAATAFLAFYYSVYYNLFFLPLRCAS
jgi:hypothetical protein